MSSVDKNLNDTVTVNVYIKRKNHDNGLNLFEYADGVINGELPTLERDEFVNQFQHDHDCKDVVVQWANDNNLNVDLVHSGMSKVVLSGTVEQFNNLFQIKLVDNTENDHTYTNHESPIVIPDQIKDHITNIIGLNQTPLKPNAVLNPNKLSINNPILTDDDFFQLNEQLKDVNPLIQPEGPLQPDYQIYQNYLISSLVANLYNVPKGDGLGGNLGILHLSINGDPNYNQGWSQSDVDLQFNTFGFNSPSITTISVDGTQNSGVSGGEAMLDISVAGMVCPKANLLCYIHYNGGAQGIYDSIDYVVNDDQYYPDVLSISYGILDIVDYEPLFAALVVRGITPLVSSGDSGAYSAMSGKNQYMISCGGTNIGYSKVGSNFIKLGESGWTYSGGGQSALTKYKDPNIATDLPSYQNNITYRDFNSSNYTFNSAKKPTKRMIPDISAPADPNCGYYVVIDGSFYGYGGTSAASPFIAGVITRLNRLLGKRIGLPMSTFYNNQSAFNDIVDGYNVVGFPSGSGNYYSDANTDGKYIGYSCTPGWDAVTGLGTINGPNFYMLFRNGETYPKENYGFRNTEGPTYPRRVSYVTR